MATASAPALVARVLSPQHCPGPLCEALATVGAQVAGRAQGDAEVDRTALWVPRGATQQPTLHRRIRPSARRPRRVDPGNGDHPRNGADPRSMGRGCRGRGEAGVVAAVEPVVISGDQQVRSRPRRRRHGRVGCRLAAVWIDQSARGDEGRPPRTVQPKPRDYAINTSCVYERGHEVR